MPKHNSSPDTEGIALAGRWTCLALAGVLALLTGCTERDAPAGELMKGRETNTARAKGDSEPTAIVVSEATQKDFGNTVEAIGTARANEALDVTAKVSNRVSAIQFHEGEEVKAGAVLVEFDSEEARANLA